ncbi:MAG: hypothetical protein ABNH26_08150 [Celeribacter sp.]
MREFLFATTGLVALAAADVTHAQNVFSPNANCAAREAVLARLANGYGETRQSVGLGSDQALVETYANDESGSWTITVTLPDGTTCLLAAGQAYEKLHGHRVVADSDA